MSEISSTPLSPSAVISLASNVLKTSVSQIKTATPDIVLFDDSSVPVEVMADLIFENIGGQELINITRSNMVNGQKISYQPIKNISLISQEYNSNNILGIQKTSNTFFAGFSINLEEKIPKVTNSVDNNPVYFDEFGNIVIDSINLNSDEQIEVQIILNGTIYDTEI